MDKKIENKFVKVVTADGTQVIADYFSGALIETPHNIEEVSHEEGTLQVTNLTSEQVDNSLISIDKQQVIIDVIDLEDQPRTSASDEAVYNLTGKGCVIITAANNEE